MKYMQHARRLSTIEGYRGYGAEQGNKVFLSLKPSYVSWVERVLLVYEHNMMQILAMDAKLAGT